MDKIALNRKQNFSLVLTLCLVHFLLGLDINIVSVSLPSIAEHFKVSAGVVTRVGWVYFLVLTSFLLLFGRLGDLRGFRKLFLSGILLFAIGSFLASRSRVFDFLIFSRVLQAVGAAILFALAPAIISTFLPEERQGKIFGMTYACIALGGIVGRAISGYLIVFAGWNALFFVGIPIAVIAFLLTFRAIPGEQPSREGRTFDVTGSFLVFFSLLCFLYLVNTGQAYGWLSTPIIILAIGALAFGYLFVRREKHITHPLLDLRILKENISFPLLSFLFVYIITNGVIYIFPFFLQWVKGIPKTQIGMLMAVMSVAQMVSGYISGYLSDRVSKARITVFAAGITLLSLILFALLDPSSGAVMIVALLIAYGVGIGSFIPANTSRVMALAPLFEKGSVSSFMATVVRAGSALGVCLFGAIFTFFVPEKNPLQAGVPVEKIMSGITTTFFFAVVVASFALLVTLKSSKQRRMEAARDS
jgi:DHA2 family metal-tetracycline-proton antiporter-like MFS transporter